MRGEGCPGEHRGPAASRREFLGAVAGGTAVGLAGCQSVTNYEFSADPAVLPVDARDRLGYSERLRKPVLDERSRTVEGTRVTATVESHVAVYGSTGDGGTAAAPVFGTTSTPSATVQGQSFNPLTRLPLSDLLTCETGRRFLRRADLDEVGHSRERVWWARGPTAIAARAGTCLGRTTGLETYAGILGGSPHSVAFVHLTRVAAESTVIAVAVHGRDIAERGRDFVGPDGGYITSAEHDAAVELFAEATGALEYA